MAEVGLKAEVRADRGKGVARKLRAGGKVPAVLYGPGGDSVALSVDARQLGQVLGTGAGMNVLVDLDLGAATHHLAIPRAIERHPVRGTVLHVDFLRIARDREVTIDVPIHIDGDARGVREGGLLEHHLWQIHLSCLPTNVPDRLSMDVRDLDMGGVIHVSDLVVPTGVTILTPGEEVIVMCVHPQAMKLEAELGAPAVAAEAGAAPATTEGSSE